MQPQKHGRSCRTSSTLQHHSPGSCAPATVTCSYIVGWHGWNLGWGNFVRDEMDARPLPWERFTMRGGAGGTEAPQVLRRDVREENDARPMLSICFRSVSP